MAQLRRWDCTTQRLMTFNKAFLIAQWLVILSLSHLRSMRIPCLQPELGVYSSLIMTQKWPWTAMVLTMSKNGPGFASGNWKCTSSRCVLPRHWWHSCKNLWYCIMCSMHWQDCILDILQTSLESTEVAPFLCQVWLAQLILLDMCQSIQWNPPWLPDFDIDLRRLSWCLKERDSWYKITVSENCFSVSDYFSKKSRKTPYSGKKLVLHALVSLCLNPWFLQDHIT